MYDIFDKLMKTKNVSAYAVSKATGVSQASLSDWKSGKSMPKYDNLKKIADFFEVPVDYLQTGMMPEIPTEVDPDSIELIELYSKLKKEQKAAVLNLLRTFAL